MAWTAPRTWVFQEIVTASLLNTHIKDNFNLLKTHVADVGFSLTAVENFAHSAGQANGTAGVDTQLTSFDVLLPANLLNGPGDLLEIDMLWFHGGTAGTFTAKIQVGSGTLATIYSVTNVNVIPHVHVLIRRRTSATGSLIGIAWATAAAGGAPDQRLVLTALSSMDWTIQQTLKVFAAHSAAVGQCRLDYYNVQAHLSTTTALV